MSFQHVSVSFIFDLLNYFLNFFGYVSAVKEFLVLRIVDFAILDRSNLSCGMLLLGLSKLSS